MIRCRLAAVLLAVLLVLCLLGGSLVGRLLEPTWNSLNQARAQAMAGRWDRAGASLAQARAGWEENHRLLSALADQQHLEQMDSLLLELETARALNQREAFAALCAQAEALAEEITEGQKLTWWNLL